MAYSNIKDPSAHFQTDIYTGDNANTHAITNDGNSDLQPDLVWIKRRDYDNQHVLHDTSRGVTKFISTDRTDAEGTISPTTKFQSFDSDGFTTGSTSGAYNASGEPFVAWQWKANSGTTSSNTDGTKTATVQANQDAGFSIVTYAGSGSASTVGHGLADTPDMIIFKNRSGANVWATYHQSLGNNYKLELNGTAAQDADGSFMNGTLPTSSVFTVGASVNTNGSGSNYVAYCFAEKQGYSKFGKYIGTGARDYAPFVYTGFKPAFVMVRCSNITGQWLMFDSARNPYNGDFDYLRANNAGAEENSGLSFVDPIDFLSNGFRVTNYDAWMNGGSNTYIYIAFAETPFVAGGVPTTAR
jgi:hypothetical protein